MESWSFSCAGQDIVLRRLPSAEGAIEEKNTYLGISLNIQADLIERCFSEGIIVPEVLAKLSPDDGLGDGFLMARVGGEALPQTLLRDPHYETALSKLSEQCAAELAKIHAITPDALGLELPTITSADALAKIEEVYRELGARIPIFELAFGWLETNLPEISEPRLVHSDFRMGNLLVDENGLRAVLDWELAHMGDPVRDIAFMCTPSWRFGRYSNEAGGFEKLDGWIADYERASQYKIDRRRFNWWLVYNTLWWGVTCILMGNSFRDKTVRTLERTIIGRRASEVEIDLLLQFEEIFDISDRSLAWEEPDSTTVSGETTYEEIAQAVREWNSEKVRPQVAGHALFESRVANNALGILQRQLSFGEIFSARQKTRLDAMKTSAEKLCKSIRQSKGEVPSGELWNHLRLLTLERLTIDQPKYAGLKIAKERWGLE